MDIDDIINIKGFKDSINNDVKEAIDDGINSAKDGINALLGGFGTSINDISGRSEDDLNDGLNEAKEAISEAYLPIMGGLAGLIGLIAILMTASIITQRQNVN